MSKHHMSAPPERVNALLAKSMAKMRARLGKDEQQSKMPRYAWVNPLRGGSIEKMTAELSRSGHTLVGSVAEAEGDARAYTVVWALALVLIIASVTTHAVASVARDPTCVRAASRAVAHCMPPLTTSCRCRTCGVC
eukprot:SAG11_NODE_112_length_16156_cov_22.455191_7_plen_136_part_00